MEINFFNIFKAFFKIGLILLGGGYVIIPVVNDELVKKRNWIDEKEAFDFYCVAQCLSGIVAMNTAILIGYRLKKLKGVFAAVLGICASPIISILIIANVIKNLMQIDFIQGIFWGVNLSVIMLIYITIKDVWKKSVVDFFSAFWFLFILILSILNVNAAILIISSIALGAVLEKIRRIKNKKEELGAKND